MIRTTHWLSRGSPHRLISTRELPQDASLGPIVLASDRPFNFFLIERLIAAIKTTDWYSFDLPHRLISTRELPQDASLGPVVLASGRPTNFTGTRIALHEFPAADGLRAAVLPPVP